MRTYLLQFQKDTAQQRGGAAVSHPVERQAINTGLANTGLAFWRGRNALHRFAASLGVASAGVHDLRVGMGQSAEHVVARRLFIEREPDCDQRMNPKKKMWQPINQSRNALTLISFTWPNLLFMCSRKA